ncbi:MAG: sodium transporter, partial [Bacteroidia bacterium]|nr:sodium transporter [Bacteroidia bacterium]
FTGVVIALVVAYLVTALTPHVRVREATAIQFKVERKDVFSKEVYFLVGFFILILMISFLIPTLFS